MKYPLLFPLFLFLTTTPTLPLHTATWETDYDIAMEKAKTAEKNILLYFTGSDWCAPCKMLQKEFFDTEDFQIEAKNYILLYVDLPRKKSSLPDGQLKKNMALLSQYNKKQVFPLLMVLNTEGEPLDEVAGYAMKGQTQSHLDLLQKHR